MNMEFLLLGCKYHSWGILVDTAARVIYFTQTCNMVHLVVLISVLIARNKQ